MRSSFGPTWPQPHCCEDLSILPHREAFVAGWDGRDNAGLGSGGGGGEGVGEVFLEDYGSHSSCVSATPRIAQNLSIAIKKLAMETAKF